MASSHVERHGTLHINKIMSVLVPILQDMLVLTLFM